MAKLYFYYSAMNAGKSTALLQSRHNCQERGMQTLQLSPEIDQCAGAHKIASRIGLTADAIIFKPDEHLFSMACAAHEKEPIARMLIDEAQFLNRPQVEQLSQVCDEIGIAVLCYCLRTDFQGNLFTGNSARLGWADNLIELKTICHCGLKATMNLPQVPDGKAIKQGEQVEIGGYERYIAMRRKHLREAM
ncbi:MAG: thymidine kinase [Lentimonas sp.]